MPFFKSDEPAFWKASPPALAYTNVFAEAVDHRVASFVLGDPDDLEAPLALFMNLPPGWVLDRHAHDCHRFEVVITGSMIATGGIVLYPGDVSTSGPGEQYGPHMAGEDGVLTLEVFSRQAGLHPDHENAKPASEEVSEMIDRLRAGLISPRQAAASSIISAWAAEAIAAQPDLQQRVRESATAEAVVAASRV
jgi:hypothetical protein